MPERPGLWNLLDHPSDPVVADAPAIDERLAHFRSLADTMRVEGQRLSRIGSGDALAGKYADELRSASRDVANDLNQVVGRYDAVVQALVEFQPALDAALTGSAAALDDAINASNAQRQADALQIAVALPGVELTPQQAESNAGRELATNAAAGRLQEAKARLAGVLANLDEAGRQAAATVRRGFSDGLTDSGWDRFKYAFKKFLKILVKVLTYIGMALAAIAILIPGVGELIMAATIAISVVAAVAELGLMALGEGSWLDLGMAVLGLVTLGGSKILGPAIKSGLRSAMGGAKNGATGRAIASGARGSRSSEEAIPLLDRTPNPVGSATGSSRGGLDGAAGLGRRGGSKAASGPGRGEPAPTKTDLEQAHEWGVPPGAKPVPHPDLGPNNAFIEGSTSWKSASGVTYTRVKNWVGYKGTTGDGASAYLNGGAKRAEGQRNGHDDDDWKAFYASERQEGAESYAFEFDEGKLKYTGGDVLRYEHGQDATIVTPASEITNANEARGLFGYGDDAVPFMDKLGENKHILRNPLGNEDGHEYALPWSLSEHGTVSHFGKMVTDGRGREVPTFTPD